MRTHRINLTAAEAARLVAGATHLLVPMRGKPDYRIDEYGLRIGPNIYPACPFEFGDRLLCREPWGAKWGWDGTKAKDLKQDVAIFLKAEEPEVMVLWRPARTMPDWAVRLNFTVKDSRPVYVPEITKEDAVKCGFSRHPHLAWRIAVEEWRKRVPWAWFMGAESEHLRNNL